MLGATKTGGEKHNRVLDTGPPPLDSTKTLPVATLPSLFMLVLMNLRGDQTVHGQQPSASMICSRFHTMSNTCPPAHLNCPQGNTPCIVTYSIDSVAIPSLLVRVLIPVLLVIDRDIHE